MNKRVLFRTRFIAVQAQNLRAHSLAFLFLLTFRTLAVAQDRLVGLTSTGGVNSGGTAFSILSNCTGFTVHTAFMVGGQKPMGSLIKGTDGNFYGMTYNGGTGSGGTIFKMTPTGTMTILKNLDPSSGYNPRGSLLKASDGNFYGMTSNGGANNAGTIFKLTPAGTFTVLKSLDYTTNGSTPMAAWCRVAMAISMA